MPKVKVIEVTGVKLDPHADYLVVVDLMHVFPSDLELALNTLNNLSQELEANTGKSVTILPVLGRPSEVVKVYQMAKEITVNQEVRLDNGESSK